MALAAVESKGTEAQAGPRSLAAQVLGAVLADMPQRAAPEPESSAATVSASPTGTVARSRLRILELDLVPGDLGRVRIVLETRDAVLGISLSTETATAAEQLQQDCEVLCERVASCGYELSGLTIRSEPFAGAPASDQVRAGDTATIGGGGAGGLPADARSSGRDGGAARRRTESSPIELHSHSTRRRAAPDRFLGMRSLQTV